MFEDIRPYEGDEIGRQIELLVDDPEFRHAASIVPGVNLDLLRQKAHTYPTLLAFQAEWERPFLEWIASVNAKGLTATGQENIKSLIDDGMGIFLMTNHRDITVDPAFVSLSLIRDFNDTCEIAIGDNLYARPWIERIVKLSRSFTIKRGDMPMMERARVFSHQSEYIRHSIVEKGNIIWMAQREGRSKDSTDNTQDALLKMLAMSGSGSFIENLKTLNIHPTTLSYEFDPCDYLKAAEFQGKRDNPQWCKGPMDDVISMSTGAMGNHGRVNIHYGISINERLDEIASQKLSRKDEATAVAHLCDRIIHSNYVIYPINQWALEVRNGAEAKGEYNDYVEAQIAKIPNADHDFAKTKIIEMYSNPLINHLKYKTL